MKYRVSIIIPCYNQGAFLGETLDSVLAQSMNDWECIIVNDGSSDDCESVALSYCNKDARFKYYYQDNSGPSVARNNGIMHSCGDFILPLDSDDIVDPTYCEKAVSVLDSNPDVKLVYCKASLFGLTVGEWKLPDYNYEDLLWRNMIFNSAFFRRSDFDKTSGYNENMREGLEDWDFWLSLLSPEDQVYRIEEVLFHYRIRTSSRNESSRASLDLLYSQIVFNHQDKYASFLSGAHLIAIHNKLYDAEDEICVLKKRFSSHSYRMGKVVVKPFLFSVHYSEHW
jgi:Glycosyltransferases involved in cell wall biogenesis